MPKSTHCGLVTPYGVIINIGSGNVLLPGRTKPLLTPVLTYHHEDPVAFIFGALSWNLKMLTQHSNIVNYIFKISPKTPGIIKLMW